MYFDAVNTFLMYVLYFLYNSVRSLQYCGVLVLLQSTAFNNNNNEYQLEQQQGDGYSSPTAHLDPHAHQVGVVRTSSSLYAGGDYNSIT